MLRERAELDVCPHRVPLLGDEGRSAVDHGLAQRLGQQLPGTRAERDLLDEPLSRAARVPALHPRADGPDRGLHGCELRPDHGIVRGHGDQRRLVRDQAPDQLRAARGKADGDRGAEGGARHVHRRAAETLDQGGEIVFLIPSRSLEATLAEAVTAAVVGHDAEGPGQLGYDGEPVVAVRPSAVHQQQRLAGPGLVVVELDFVCGYARHLSLFRWSSD